MSIPNYQRIFDMANSDGLGMLFCQGCVSEMGTDVFQAIRTVGEQGKIVFVHFRNIRGTPYDFQEVFIDEGDVDMVGAMQTYREIGYDGPVMLDHTPGIPEQGRVTPAQPQPIVVSTPWGLLATFRPGDAAEVSKC